MPARVGQWGTAIEREVLDGVPFRMYDVRPRHVAHLLREGGRWSSRTYVAHAGHRMTYADLEALARGGATVLRDRGVEPGDSVLLCGHNSTEWVVAFWAALCADAVVAVGNAWWSDEEMANAIGTVSPKAVLADDATRATSDGSALGLEMVVRAARSASAAPSPEARDENTPAVVVFTSGTTGLPKGAALSHRAVIALQHSLLAVTSRLPGQAECAVGEVSLQTGPLFHIGGIQALLRCFLTGGTMVFPAARFDPGEVLDLIETEGVERWGGVPTMLNRVLHHPNIHRRDLSSLRSLTLGGSPVPVELVERCREHFPNLKRAVSQIYGLSEAGGTLTSASGRDLALRPGTVGRPLPLVELHIADPNSDGVGEVLARTPTQMSGYVGRVDEAPIDHEGWLHTGDLGWRDEDGYLYVTGRLKDLIIRGGENVASVHVEDVLRAHDDVLEVAVLGLPDPDLGEVVGAAVVLRDGATPDEAALRGFAATRLAYFEVPTCWWLRDEPLPANAIGKVDKRQLLAVWPEPARQG